MQRFNHQLQNMIKSRHHCWKSWEGKAWNFMGSISMCHPCMGKCAGLISKQDSLMQIGWADPNKLNVGQRVCLYNTICSFSDSFLTVMCYFFFPVCLIIIWFLYARTLWHVIISPVQNWKLNREGGGKRQKHWVIVVGCVSLYVNNMSFSSVKVSSLF